jgi:hypothetical protein
MSTQPSAAHMASMPIPPIHDEVLALLERALSAPSTLATPALPVRPAVPVPTSRLSQKPTARAFTWAVSRVPQVRAEIIRSAEDERKSSLNAARGNQRTQAYTDHGISHHNDQAQRLLRVVTGLKDSEMFWVSEDMVTLAVDASSDVPGFTPETDMPSRSGLMVLEKALPAITGFLAVPMDPKDVIRGTVSTAHADLKTSLEIVALSWVNAGGRLTIHGFSRNEGGPADDPFNSLMILDEDNSSFKSFSAVDQGAAAPLLKFLAASFHLMANPAVADRRQAAPEPKAPLKPAKRRHSNSVTVISLRSLRQVETCESGNDGREYTHRWIVRGHWRNQPYGKDQALRRITWVPSYIKGPAGKPLRATERVWAWRR